MGKRLEDYTWEEIREYEAWDPYYHPFSVRALEYRVIRDEWERERKAKLLYLIEKSDDEDEIDDYERELFDLMAEAEVREYQTKKLQEADARLEVEFN